MAIREFIPIRPATSTGLTHATALEVARKTLCGKKCDAWVIASGKLTCPTCKDEIAGVTRGR